MSAVSVHIAEEGPDGGVLDAALSERLKERPGHVRLRRLTVKQLLFVQLLRGLTLLRRRGSA